MKTEHATHFADQAAEVARLTAALAEAQKIERLALDQVRETTALLDTWPVREQRAREEEREACEVAVHQVIIDAPWDTPEPTERQRAFVNGLHAAKDAIRSTPTRKDGDPHRRDEPTHPHAADIAPPARSENAPARAICLGDPQRHPDSHSMGAFAGYGEARSENAPARATDKGTWDDGFTEGYNEAFEMYGKPAPVPEGMETTAEERARWAVDADNLLWATMEGPYSVVVVLIRDLDRALAEIARWQVAYQKQVDYAAEHATHFANQTAEIARLTRSVQAWMDTAAFHARNEDYYRGLIIQIGEALPLPDAYVSDDSSAQDSVLCAKVPELVQAEIARLTAALDAREIVRNTTAARVQRAREEEREACREIAIVHGAMDTANAIRARSTP